MSSLLVTGASGFIGARFISLHRDKFTSINALGRRIDNSSSLENVEYHSLDLLDTKKIKDLAKGVRHIVHIAYDKGNPRKNLQALEKLIGMCHDLHIRSFIHLSSFVVYDPDLVGTVNEKSGWSTINDPYTRVKQESELMLTKASKHGLNVTTLQPTVVYGLPGNWSLHAAKSIASGKLILPEAGRTICNAVHVDDVADAILLAVKAHEKPTSANLHNYLISSRNPSTWAEFYATHRPLVENDFAIEALDNNNRYSDSKLEQSIYALLFSRAGYALFKYAFPLLRSLIKSSKSPVNLHTMIEQGRLMSAFIPKGMNRVYHSSRFVTDINKAVTELGYSPKKDLSGFRNEIKA